MPHAAPAAEGDFAGQDLTPPPATQVEADPTSPTSPTSPDDVNGDADGSAAGFPSSGDDSSFSPDSGSDRSSGESPVPDENSNVHAAGADNTGRGCDTEAEADADEDADTDPGARAPPLQPFPDGGRYDSKDDFKEMARDWALDQGFRLTVSRLTRNAAGTHTVVAMQCPVKDPRLVTPENARRRFLCPFVVEARVDAIDNKWVPVVRNGTHNHPLDSALSSGNSVSFTGRSRQGWKKSEDEVLETLRDMGFKCVRGGYLDDIERLDEVHDALTQALICGVARMKSRSKDEDVAEFITSVRKIYHIDRNKLDRAAWYLLGLIHRVLCVWNMDGAPAAAKVQRGQRYQLFNMNGFIRVDTINVAFMDTLHRVISKLGVIPDAFRILCDEQDVARQAWADYDIGEWTDVIQQSEDPSAP